MEKKLPNLFKKNVTREHVNNKKIAYSTETLKKDDLSVEEKLKKLFKSSRYIFNIDVIIITKNKEYDTRIIGKIKNSIIIEEGIEIPIIEIEDRNVRITRKELEYDRKSFEKTMKKIEYPRKEELNQMFFGV